MAASTYSQRYKTVPRLHGQVRLCLFLSCPFRNTMMNVGKADAPPIRILYLNNGTNIRMLSISQTLPLSTLGYNRVSDRGPLT